MKKDFPIFENHKGLAYLDNAATTHKPKTVINKITEFYEKHNANPHRGIYKLADEATTQTEQTRKLFAEILNTETDQIIFTRNATAALSDLSRSLQEQVSKENNIIITEIEHHANFVNWQQLAKKTGAKLKIAEYDIETDEIQPIQELVDKNTKIVAFTHMSNVTGKILPAKQIIKEIRNKNPSTIIVLDACQSMPHQQINTKEIDADFIAFSAHKMYGPMGVGVLYGKKEQLEILEPFNYGGHMIKTVTKEKTEFAESPDRFEAGTMNAAGIAATAEAIKYIQKIGYQKIQEKEEELTKYLLQELKKEDAKIIGHDNGEQKAASRTQTTESQTADPRGSERSYGPVVSFILKGIHPHDLATLGNKYQVCIRAGHHCAEPLMKKLGISATARASVSFYNEKEDVDKLIQTIRYTKRLING